MKEQNYSNHRRYVPAYHFILSPLSVIYFFGAVLYLIISIVNGLPILLPVLVVIGGINFVLLYIFCRYFALKVQDRAIRAEENLRYFVLTGKQFDSRLKIGQIIALRFAPDDEFIALANRALEEDLSADGIKRAILHWKADECRA